MGVQVGDGSTQIIYNYHGTEPSWADGVAPAPLTTVSGTVVSPYRGLAAFGPKDAPYFFGREDAVAAVLARMSRFANGPGLLMVSGASGAGKSSLLQAGVLPRLQGVGLETAPQAASWPCLVFTPGPAPLGELAAQVAPRAGAVAGTMQRELAAHPEGFAFTARQAALAAGAAGRARLLMIIDQFEQLFTLCPDAAQQEAFIVALHAAATVPHGAGQLPAALVVLVVRADFETRCARFPQLADAVQDRYLLQPMRAEQLRSAITEPVKRIDARVDGDLVEQLMGEVRSRHQAAGVGVLPLLSHALDQAWRGRPHGSKVLTVADYDRTGGIERAVADSAQRAYTSLTPAQQAAARPVFIRLTATTPDGIDTSRRATLVELTESTNPNRVIDVEAVLAAFTAERLLTLSDGTVEISHEILLSAWPLLHDTWLAETHADRVVRTRLQNTATDWQDHHRDSSYLYKGSLLEAAGETAARAEADPDRHPSLSPAERAFLHASRRARERAERLRHRVVALLAAALAVILVVATLAVIFGWTAQHQQQQAVLQRDAAISDELAARSEAIGEADPRVARLLSIAADRIHPSSDARYAMLTAAATPGINILVGHTGAVTSVAYSPDGKTLASGSSDGTIRFWNAVTGRQVNSPLAGHAGSVNSVAFSPDGKTLATGSSEGTVVLWGVDTGREVGAPLVGHADQVNSVAFSPDGKTLATGSDGGSGHGTLSFWKVATGKPIGDPIVIPDGAATSVAFSPDGTVLAVGTGHGTVRFWDVATGREVGTPLVDRAGYVTSVAFSPDGKTLATGSSDSTARLWNIAARRAIGAPLFGNDDMVTSVAFSPDGKTLATGGAGGSVWLWDVATGGEIGTPLAGHTGAVTSVAFSPDGKTLATGSTDKTIRLWNVTASHQVGTALAEGTSSPTSIAFSPGGMLAISSGLGRVSLWSGATNHEILTLTAGHSGYVTSVAFSPDGKTLVGGTALGRVLLWNAASGRSVLTLSADRADTVTSVAFSPDGKTLAASVDGTVLLWDAVTGHKVSTLSAGPTSDLTSLAFSPDGKTLAGGTIEGAVQLWQVDTGYPIGTPFAGDTGAVNSVAFSPDGKTLASGSDDRTIRLWNVAAGRQIGVPLAGDTSAVTSVAFSPDGDTLASGSTDGTARLWDVATSRQIGAPLAGEPVSVTSVAFSPDGKTLATGSTDGTAQLWDVRFASNPAAFLCSSTATFTPAEWTQWIPAGPAYQNLCP